MTPVEFDAFVRKEIATNAEIVKACLGAGASGYVVKGVSGPDLVEAALHPVDRREIVANDVLAILRELDTESLEGAPVQAGEKPLDNRAGAQLERAEPRDDGGIEELSIADR